MTPPDLLERPYRIVLFDWDGTAVVDRREDATLVRSAIERLLRVGVFVVVVTGTSLKNVDTQLSAAMRGPHKRNLFLATNRGSEIYGFDEHGKPVRLSVRTATPDEERVMTEIADAVRDELEARTGLDVRVVYDRMNRRKIDLIPVAQWSDPPKAAIAELLAAVESRLTGAGIAAGLREVIERAHRICTEHGLSDARITTDVKHLEIGLTDKSDSVAWVLDSLARPFRIEPRDILIGGDEFGSLGGVLGSDSLLMVRGTEGAAVVSVGVEPEGVPPGVVHLPGGPARFRALLREIAARHPVGLPVAPTTDPAWCIAEEGFVVEREHEIESLFAIGNGFIGCRASLAEGSALSAPATFIAGIYESSGGAVPSLATIPDWTRLAAHVEGQPLRLDAGEMLEHRRTLDLAQGILWREWLHRDPEGRITRIVAFRVASRAHRHLLLQSVLLRAENYTGTLTTDSGIGSPFTMRTSGGCTIAVTDSVELETPEAVLMLVSPSAAPNEPRRFALGLEVGKTYRYDRALAVATCRDGDDPLGVARAEVDRAIDAGAAANIDAHRRAWRTLWRAADIEIEGDADAQRALRFAIYHLLAAGSPEDDRVSIGARALTGKSYAGHVFWDTEIYMVPFYTLVWPEAARALLTYRHHTLPASRAKAAQHGYRGAFYAWESADTGEEVSPRFVIAPDGELVEIHVGEQEIHISADVAYAIWSYWRATGDDAFMLEKGAEIVLETARFWASRVELGDDGAYHIRRVIGPDEYHSTVDDDAFTNGMAQWNLEIAAELASLLAERWPARWRELAAALQWHTGEARGWVEIAARMYTGLDPRTGVIEQFRGYHALEDIDLSAYEPREAPMDVVLGRERIRRSQVIKQPDVLMLIHLLWDRFPQSVRQANFDHYDRRTGHGSSLSPSIHALLAARLGRIDLAHRYFREAAHIDLADSMGNAAGGVHMAALGGLWQSVVLGFAGLSTGGDEPVVAPALPSHWRRLALGIRWRGRELRHELPASRSPTFRQEVAR